MENEPGHVLIAAELGGALVPTGKTKHHRLLFEFDSTDVLKRWQLEFGEGNDRTLPITVALPGVHGADSAGLAPEFESLPDSARVFRSPHWFAAVALSPEGATLAASDTEGRLCIRNLKSGSEAVLSPPAIYEPLHRAVPSLVFTSGGDRLVVLARGVQVVDPAIPSHIEIPEQRSTPRDIKEQREAMAFAITHDGSTLARGDSKGTVRIGSLALRGDIHSFRAHKHEVFSLSYSPDGTLLATAGGDHYLRLWDVASWERIAELPRDAWAVRFSPDGSSLAVLCRTHVEIWPVKALAYGSAGSASRMALGPAHAFLLPYDSQFSLPSEDLMWPRRASLAYSADGRYLAAAAGSAAIYDTVRRRVVWRYLVRSRTRGDAVADFAFMQGGHRAAVATKKSVFIIGGDWEGH